MAQVAVVSNQVVPTNKLPVAVERVADYAKKPSNCQIAEARHALIVPIINECRAGNSLRSVVVNTLSAVATNAQHPLAAVAHQVAVGGRTVPAKSAVMQWIKAYKEHGYIGIIPKRMGKQAKRDEYNWRGVALAHYNQPSKPHIASIHRLLVEVHGYQVSIAQVRKFLSGIPSNLGAYSKKRLGAKSHRLWERWHNSRTTDDIEVGDLYMADGHTLDVYLRHPISNKPFRAELVVWMDVRSRYIVGWSLGNAESTHSTLHAMSSAIDRHQHVPALVYVDNGCGYGNQTMTDEATGYFYRLGIDPMFALPEHPHSKGNIERFFRTMEEDFNKTLLPTAFVGRGMSKEVMSRTFRQAPESYPTTYEWAEVFNQWLCRYHGRPHPEIKNTTPLAMWSQLKPIEPHATV